MDDLLLGLDVGTSHIKGVLAAPDGRIVARARVTYPTHYPRPGWAEQNPHDWIHGAAAVVRALTVQCPGRVQAIGVSGQGCAVTLVDATGEMVRPAIIWLDSRAEPQSERLRNCCEAEVLRRNGKIPAPYNVEPTLMWLMEHEPASIHAAQYSLTTTAYINRWLTGHSVANLSDASILLAYDLEKHSWSEDLIESFGIPARLYPALAACDQVIGGLAAGAAAELGLPEGIPVIAGGEDTSSSGLACGAVTLGQTYLSLGTAGTVYVPVDRLPVHPQLLTFLHVLAGQYLVGGSMAALGGSLAWLRSLLDPTASFEALIALAEDSRPGAGQVLFLPYLSGELQPINDGYARGMLFGLSLSTQKADLVRAVLEGTAFAVAHNLAIIGEMGIPVKEIRAIGGPTRSALWCRILADVTGCPLLVMDDDGGAPLGDAILAGKGCGLIQDAAETALQAGRVVGAFEPDPAHREVYAAMFGLYRELYPRVQEQSARLARLSG